MSQLLCEIERDSISHRDSSGDVIRSKNSILAKKALQKPIQSDFVDKKAENHHMHSNDQTACCHILSDIV
jgi:hypothetical protein